MATPQEKLALSLEVLHELQSKNNKVGIQTSDLNRTHRERLIKNGFIKEVTKGWYIATNPTEKVGDSTSWYTSYWKFCGQYLKAKYKNDYCISAEQSLLIHSGNTTIPAQLVVRAIKSSNTVVNFIFNTSLLAMQSPLPANADITEIDGLRILTLPSSLIHCSPTMFEKNPIDMRIALAKIPDSSEILRLLLDGSHTVVAGRLAGAFRNLGRDRIADDIVQTMRAADFDVRENDPFENRPATKLTFREKSPYANRIRLLWQNFREVVIKHFPESPGLPDNKEAYLKEVEDIYATDAYHSLSIERYFVSPELIHKVRSGSWDSAENSYDKRQRDAMAARGYWQASRAVKKSIEAILEGTNPGMVADKDHSDWYRELFAPSVSAGILKPSDLAGYRTNQVYIAQSMYVPLNKDAVRDTMPVLFELLEMEDHAGTRAVLGHFIFVYIHPYMDGNGRMGRFLMNVMLASGGYPWTVIPVEQRDAYMQALEKASVDNNIEPLAIFISNLVDQSQKGTPIAQL
tara:strand:- start:3895 stop:5445 length:1551 start_codon:yes stop_codon:yes gene_type:complete